MPAWRAANACLTAALLLVSATAVFDSVVHHGATKLTLWLLGGILWFGLMSLLSAYLAARSRARVLEESTSGLQSLAEKLEDCSPPFQPPTSGCTRARRATKGSWTPRGTPSFAALRTAA